MWVEVLGHAGKKGFLSMHVWGGWWEVMYREGKQNDFLGNFHLEWTFVFFPTLHSTSRNTRMGQKVVKYQTSGGSRVANKILRFISLLNTRMLLLWFFHGVPVANLAKLLAEDHLCLWGLPLGEKETLPSSLLQVRNQVHCPVSEGRWPRGVSYSCKRTCVGLWGNDGVRDT